MSANVGRARQLVDIVIVIGADVNLVESTSHLFWGPCPFHAEPQSNLLLFPPQPKDRLAALRDDLVVNRDRKIYRCFGCNARGDSIEYVMRRDKVSEEVAAAWILKNYHVEP